MNPLWPYPAHLVWSTIALVGSVLAVIAVVEVVKSPNISALPAGLWIAFIVLAPVIGLVVWFALAGLGTGNTPGVLNAALGREET